MKLVQLVPALTLIFLSCISKPLFDSPECVESWEEIIHISQIFSGPDKIDVKLVSYIKCKFGGRMGFPSPRYGFRVYVSVLARPYAFIEDAASPDTLTLDALKVAVQSLRVSISLNQRHFLYQRHADDTTTVTKLFHLMEAGPAFTSSADSTLASSLPINWKKIMPPEKIILRMLADTASSDPFEPLTSNMDMFEAILQSRPVMEIDSVVFGYWPYCDKNCKALVEKRLKEYPQTTLSFFHRKFSGEYVDEFSKIPASDIIIYDQILKMICLLPDTSNLTKVTHSQIWSYAIETSDQDLKNLPDTRKRQLCACLGDKKSKIPASRSALIQTLCSENR